MMLIILKRGKETLKNETGKVDSLSANIAFNLYIGISDYLSYDVFPLGQFAYLVPGSS